VYTSDVVKDVVTTVVEAGGYEGVDKHSGVVSGER